MIDTHTADGLKVAREHLQPGVPMIVLETALPIKFAGDHRRGAGPRARPPGAVRGHRATAQARHRAARRRAGSQGIHRGALCLITAEVPMKVVGFAGFSGSGKTTLVERLIPALKLRGLRVSVVKHAHHKFDIDHPGKDTYRHREAGAFEVVVASDQRLALIREFEQPAQLTVHHLIAELYEGVDWVLVEGFKESNLLKIEVWRARIGQAGAVSRRRFHRGHRHRLAGAAAPGHPAPRAGFERSGSGGPVAHGQSRPLRLPPGDVFMNAPRPPAAAAGRCAGRVAGACAAAGGHRDGVDLRRRRAGAGAGPGVRRCRCRRRTTAPWTAMRCAAARSPTGACRCRSASAFPPAAAAEPLAPGSAARIFTGAPIPAGADAVVMQEDTEPAGEQTVRILRRAQARPVDPPQRRGRPARRRRCWPRASA